MNGVQEITFSGPFCLGVTRKTGEAKGSQRDAKETAKKSDGPKHGVGRERPHFRPFGLESDPWGRSRPAAQQTAPRFFAPSPQGEEKRRELAERKESKC